MDEVRDDEDEDDEVEALPETELRVVAGSTSIDEPSVPDVLDGLDEACLDAKSWERRNDVGIALEGPAIAFPEA